MHVERVWMLMWRKMRMLGDEWVLFVSDGFVRCIVMAWYVRIVMEVRSIMDVHCQQYEPCDGDSSSCRVVPAFLVSRSTYLPRLE